MLYNFGYTVPSQQICMYETPVWNKPLFKMVPIYIKAQLQMASYVMKQSKVQLL